MMPAPQRNKAPAGHERPATETALGREASSAYQMVGDRSTASVTPFPRKRQSLRRKASARLAQLYRLAQFRRQHALASVDGSTFVFVLASTLACGQPGRDMLRGRVNRATGQEARPRFVEWHGLDIDTLREAVRRADLGHFGTDELMTVIEAVRRFEGRAGHTWIGAARLGELLQLTSIERDDARVWSADAVDEPAAERRQRKTEERKMKDQENKRAQRGRKARPLYLAAAEERRRYCEAHGITDRTLRRWIKAGKVDVRSVSTYQYTLTQGATHFGHVASSLSKHTAAGPARPGGDNRGGGAGVPSHGGKVIKVEASRSLGATAIEVETGGSVIALSPRPREADPGEPPFPALRPVVSRIVGLIEHAAAILETIRDRVPDTPDLNVADALDHLESIATMLWLSSADLPESADETARNCGRAVADLIGLIPANDNRLAALARGLAA